MKPLKLPPKFKQLASEKLPDIPQKVEKDGSWTNHPGFQGAKYVKLPVVVVSKFVISDGWTFWLPVPKYGKGVSPSFSG